MDLTLDLSRHADPYSSCHRHVAYEGAARTSAVRVMGMRLRGHRPGESLITRHDFSWSRHMHSSTKKK